MPAAPPDPAAVPDPARLERPSAPAVRPETGPGGGWRSALAVVGAVVVSVLLAHRVVVFSGLSWLPGDAGDARFCQYILEHAYRWLAGDPLHARFWDLPVYFPARNAEAYSDTMLGIAPAYVGWRLLGVARDPAMALCVLTFCALNAVAMFLLLRRTFERSRVASAVGAVLFAAGASRINSVISPQMLFGGYGVITFAAVIHACRDHGRRGHLWALVACLVSVVHLYGSFYNGWFFGFFLLIALGWTLAFAPLRGQLGATLRAHAVALGLGAVLAVLLLWPLLSHSLRGLHDLGPREYWPVTGMLPTVQSWFNMGEDSWLYGFAGGWRIFTQLTNENRHRLGLGLVTLVAAGAGLRRIRTQPAIRLMLAVAATAVLLTMLYRGGHSPWFAVFHLVPGASALRLVQRIGIWLLLPASIGLAVTLDQLIAGRRVVAAGVVAAACLLEQGLNPPAFAMPPVTAEVAALEARIPADCQVLLYTPNVADADRPWLYHLRAMFAALDRGIPTVNGYSSYDPPGWDLHDVEVGLPVERKRVDAAVERWMRVSGLDPARLCRLE